MKRKLRDSHLSLHKHIYISRFISMPTAESKLATLSHQYFAFSELLSDNGYVILE